MLALTSRSFVLADTALQGLVNGNKFRGRRRYQVIDNIMVNGLYEDMKRKVEKNVEWRILSLKSRTYTPRDLQPKCQWIRCL